MEQRQYSLLENYMKECMQDSAHDQEHVYRVLYLALDLANYETNVNQEVLIAACLLHDIGREKQFENPFLCHAQIGAEMAYEFCKANGFSSSDAQHIKDCISTHRYRSDNTPESMEAKILFDADKLDVTGAIGIARTLIYKGQVNEPLYNTDEKGNVFTKDPNPSFMREYNFKLKDIYDKFYTQRAHQIASIRQKSAVSFYDNILSEIQSTYKSGVQYLESALVD